jgi:Tol biopolymer transport system component
LESLNAQPLAGTEDAYFPFWSPDSRFIGFFSEGKVKKVSVFGGFPQTICDAEFGLGGTWNKDGVILFAPNFHDSIFRVSAEGGTPIPVTTVDASRQELRHTDPIFLPDGDHFLYHVRGKNNEELGVHIGSLSSTFRKQIFREDIGVAYTAGFLLFLRDDTLFAQRFNTHRLDMTGNPFMVAEKVKDFSVSDNGMLGYLSREYEKVQLAWFDRQGRQLGTVGEPGEYIDVEISPDEKSVALERQDVGSGKGQIWITDLRRDATSRLHYDVAWEYSPRWSPDGSKIAFSSNRQGPGDLYLKSVAGTEEPELLLKGGFKAPLDWSRDGRYILYEETNDRSKGDIWAWPQFEDQKPFAAVQTKFDETGGRFSPDSRWITYVSNRSNPPNVFVKPFPSLNAEWQVSINGGLQPRWRRDGKELFYIAPDGTLAAVDIKTVPNFHAGVPHALFSSRIAPLEWRYWRCQYAVAENGRKFLMAVSTGERSPSSIVLVTNWNRESSK